MHYESSVLRKKIGYIRYNGRFYEPLKTICIRADTEKPALQIRENLLYYLLYTMAFLSAQLSKWCWRVQVTQTLSVKLLTNSQSKPKHLHWLCNIAIQLISYIALSTPIVANKVLAHCSTNKKQSPVSKKPQSF